MKRVNIKCPYCHSQAFLRSASMVHGGAYRQPGEEVYVCARYPACDSYVSAHRRTRLPMGTLANRPLRVKRMEAHESFNRLWKSGMMTRTAAYRWLQVQLACRRRMRISPSSQNGGASRSSGSAISFLRQTTKRHSTFLTIPSRKKEPS